VLFDELTGVENAGMFLSKPRERGTAGMAFHSPKSLSLLLAQWNAGPAAGASRPYPAGHRPGHEAYLRLEKQGAARFKKTAPILWPSVPR
jgi:hypothetical protein